MKKWIVIAVVVIAVAGAVFYRVYRIRHQSMAQSIDKIQQAQGLPVRVFVVRPEDIEKTVVVSGGIEPLQDVAIAAKVTDRIAAIHVKTGEHVSEGQLLVSLDTTSSGLRLEQAKAALAEAQHRLAKLKNGSRPEEIAAAEATRREAEAAANLAQIEYERQQNLYKDNATTLQNVQRTRNKYRSAQAKLEAARAQAALVKEGPRQEDIDMARAQVQLSQANVDQCRQDFSDHFLYAPCDGVVTLRRYDIGNLVKDNKPIFHVLTVDPVYLDIDVSEIYLPYITTGMAVKVTIDALKGETFTGHIAEINPAADRASRAFRVRILLANGKGKLKPGMFGRAHIITKRIAGALLVPTDTVKRDAAGEHFVWAVDENDTVRRVPVKVGGSWGNRQEITEGLQSGMRLVSMVQGKVQEGAKVTIAQEDNGLDNKDASAKNSSTL